MIVNASFDDDVLDACQMADAKRPMYGFQPSREVSRTVAIGAHLSSLNRELP